MCEQSRSWFSAAHQPWCSAYCVRTFPAGLIRDQVSLNRSVVILQSLPNLVALRDRRLIQLAGREGLSGKKASEEFDVRVVMVDLR